MKKKLNKKIYNIEGLKKDIPKTPTWVKRVYNFEKIILKKWICIKKKYNIR